MAEEQLVMRFAEIQHSTANTSDRSVDVIIATENPVERYDKTRGIVIREVLAMAGVEFRGGRTQLPIVDSHDRSTVANVLGSVRGIKVVGDELIGRAYFASDEESQRAFQKLLDGHLTDFSITASPKEVGFVERGERYTTRRGDVVEGPADIVTRWMPTDASLVATGADERSVVRRSYTDIPLEIERMDENMLGQLSKLGMPAEITDPNAAMAWVLGYLTDQNATPASEPIESMEEEPLADPTSSEEVENMEGEEEEVMKEEKEADMAELQKAVDRAISADRTRQKEIRAICVKSGMERSFADDLCDSGATVNAARTKVLDKMSERNQPVGSSPESVNVSQGDNGIDRMLQDATDGITRAALGAINRTPSDDKTSDGAVAFAAMGLQRTAERLLRQVGAPVERMSRIDIAKAVMGSQETLRKFGIRRDGEAFHVTGSFPNLLLDAANKTLLAGYEEAEYTWSVWARQAPSVADFKAINRIRFSESPDLENVAENADYPEGEMSDAKESYKVEKYGKMFSVSWETVVNDDLDAISRIPQMHGVAARRLQNKKVYEVLTANEALADGVALFAAGHSNLDSSGAVPSVAELNAAFQAMMTQTGLNSSVIINVQPRYIIVPAALSGSVLELLQSTSPPAVGGSAVGTSGTANIYGPGGQRPLTAVVEPQLDGNSATAWYLAADPSQIDTVELSFLQGEESPVLENEWDFSKDVYRYKIRQTFGVKAIDHRGLYKNPGT